MIVKKVPARPAGRNATIERATHARRLVDYLRSPEKQSAEKAYMVAYMLEAKLGQTAGERLFHQGARGFVSTTLAGQRAEMIAIAQMATRSPNPVDHWILSWPEGELPEPEQIDEVVAMFVGHLGVADQPCIYAVHGDTHNRHLHIALNRYDAVGRRMVEINDGFNLEAAHQAVAIIVDRFGWRPEAEARYEIVGGRVGLTTSAQARIEEGRESIRPDAAAYENRTGYRSAQRIAQHEALPIIAAAGSWRELHARLADVGMTYTPKGTNGVVIEVEHEKVKASTVSPTITRTRLEKRLGPFEPAGATLLPTPRVADLDRFPDAFRADEYRAEREHWRQRGRPAAASGPEPGKERKQSAGSRKEGDEAESGDDQSLAKPDRPPPDLESWYYSRREGVLAARWRNRKRLEPLPAFAGEPRPDLVQPSPIDEYHAYTCSGGVRYARGPQDPTAFIDRGGRVDVVLNSDEALLAGLRLAVLKTGGPVIVRADPEIRDRIFALAAANGLRQCVQEPDRQEAPRSREALTEASTPSTEPEPPNVDRIISEAPPVQVDRRPTGLSDPTSPSASAEIAPAGIVEPPLAQQAPAATPTGRIAEPASTPRFTLGDQRQPDGAARQMTRDHLRKRAESAKVRESSQAGSTVETERRVDVQALKTPGSVPIGMDDVPTGQSETKASSPKPTIKLKRSPGKGPDDLDILPPGWPPSRGSSRG